VRINGCTNIVVNYLKVLPKMSHPSGDSLARESHHLTMGFIPEYVDIENRKVVTSPKPRRLPFASTGI